MAAISSGSPLPGALYAVLFIPDFPVAVRQRGERQPGPAAVACGEAPNRFVYAADARAREHGVHAGMALTAAQVRYRSAGTVQPLRVLDRDEQSELRVQGRLRKLAQTTTPRFEDIAPGLLALDCNGLREPYASTQRLAADVARLGLQANVGVSQNRFVALCAARTQKGITHIYPGQEAGFLLALPLDALPLEKRDLEILGRWGVRTIGELARLPDDQLAERFGARGARMARLARGEEGSLLQAYRPPAQFELSWNFDWEICALEPLSFAMSDMLDRLCLKLQGFDQAAASLTTRLRLADGGVLERTIDLPHPLSDPRTLLKLVRIDLAAHPPDKAVEGVYLSAKPTKRRWVQHSLFRLDAPSPETWAATLAQLNGLVGEARVGAPAVPDTHRPGAAALKVFEAAGEEPGTGHLPAPGPGRAAVAPRETIAVSCKPLESSRRRPCPSPSLPALRSSLVFRCFRPSWPAHVRLNGDRPVHVHAKRIHGAVTARAGPWRVSGEWWTPDSWQYQEWDIEVAGCLYRACCERATRKWFLTGEYD